MVCFAEQTCGAANLKEPYIRVFRRGLMDLRQAARIWRARWILTSTLLTLALVGAAGAAAEIPRHYQSTSSVVLLAPPAASAQNGGNPFLSFSPSLTLTADALSRELMAPSAVEQLAARGFTASYTVALPSYTTSTTGSVVQVTVTGTNAVTVQRTLQGVTAQVGTQLAELQRGVAASSQISAETLTFTPQAALSISQTARPLVVVGLLLLLICLGAPIVVDGLATSRQPGHRSTLSEDWALLDISAFPHRSTFPEEPTIQRELAFPGESAGWADQ
jgi:hypothetical protein